MLEFTQKNNSKKKCWNQNGTFLINEQRFESKLKRVDSPYKLIVQFKVFPTKCKKVTVSERERDLVMK